MILDLLAQHREQVGDGRELGFAFQVIRLQDHDAEDVLRLLVGEDWEHGRGPIHAEEQGRLPKE